MPPPSGRRRTAAGGAAGRERLARYSSKRDFAATPEPAPGAAEPSEEQRFVIHEHHARRLHWDLRLERDGALVSWAVPKGLPQDPGENRFAAATEDHPLEYLGFHGEIPAGEYGAGSVSIWDTGTYRTLKWEPAKVEIELHGARVHGRYALFPIDGEHPAKDWMIHRMDPAQDPAREPMPSHLLPMLARAGELPPEDGRWAHELKWDGVRALLYSSPGELRAESRNLNDITATYPELSRAGRALGSHSAILDGEIVAFDEQGLPSFAALQRRMHTASRARARRLARETPVTYVVFDLLWLDGHPVMDLPYSERRELLSALDLAGESVQIPDHLVGHGAELLQMCTERGLEGVVAKRLDSTYRPGLRTGEWVKVKTSSRQEFIVGGWLPGKGRRSRHIGALLLGVLEPGSGLRHVGRVGSGLSESELERLSALLEPLRREGTPFSCGAKVPREAVFCEPEVVVEVRFTSWTKAGSLRHPTYLGLRTDRSASEVVREQASSPAADGQDSEPPPLAAVPAQANSARVRVQGRELSLTNLTKVLYPQSAFTKRELIEYYAAVAPAMLGHLEDRALTVTRWPDGVQGKSFFQKQAPAHRPAWLQTASAAPGRGGRSIDYVLAQDTAALVWLANAAAIELHAPLARAQDPRLPTAVVFDLDPGAPAGMAECCRVAATLAGMFENLGLQSFAKTSGSKGLQVYLPLNCDGVGFEQTKLFARTVAQLLEQADGELVVSNMSKARREGRVLIDWSQNDEHKTTVCVYSLRATELPSVSMPLEWEEVRSVCDGADADALRFSAAAALRRVAGRGDLFAPVLSLVQRLPTL